MVGHQLAPLEETLGCGSPHLQFLLAPQPPCIAPHLVKPPGKPALLFPVTCLKQKARCCVRWPHKPDFTPCAVSHDRSSCAMQSVFRHGTGADLLSCSYSELTKCGRKGPVNFRMWAACVSFVLLVKTKTPDSFTVFLWCGGPHSSSKQIFLMLLVAPASSFLLLSALYWARGLGKINKKKAAHLELW